MKKFVLRKNGEFFIRIGRRLVEYAERRRYLHVEINKKIRVAVKEMKPSVGRCLELETLRIAKEEIERAAVDDYFFSSYHELKYRVDLYEKTLWPAFVSAFTGIVVWGLMERLNISSNSFIPISFEQNGREN